MTIGRETGFPVSPVVTTFSKSAEVGSTTSSGVDRPLGQVGHNRAGEAGLGSSTFPADFSPLRTDASTDPSSVCAAATTTSPEAAGGGAASDRHWHRAPSTSPASAPGATGGGVPFHHPAPRLPRHSRFAWCLSCEARGRLFIRDRCVVCGEAA